MHRRGPDGLSSRGNRSIAERNTRGSASSAASWNTGALCGCGWPFALRQRHVRSGVVLQCAAHLSKENARLTFAGGWPSVAFIWAISCANAKLLWHSLSLSSIRRGFRERHDFDVRYWTPRELASTFRPTLGSARIFVDGFFSLNPQISDVRFLAWNYRTVVYASEALRRISGIVPPLTYLADSLYVEGTKGR